LALAHVEGRRVIDVGCGDGTYSAELKRAGAAEVLGIDAAAEAVASARRRAAGTPGLHFEVMDTLEIEAADEPFDVAVVRGLLHHLYDVEEAIARISKLAPEIIVLEPNGYNPVLKVIERVSPYHVRHEEKSYAPHRLDRWFARHGGRIEERAYIGLVPFFCPDWMARILKAVEPIVEATPLLRSIACGQYVLKIDVR
jgi:2-polyprenyl-3-methyl-5-hydroxy-6-metoxy-1,4-benzoquinol methylase